MSEEVIKGESEAGTYLITGIRYLVLNESIPKIWVNPFGVVPEDNVDIHSAIISAVYDCYGIYQQWGAPSPLDEAIRIHAKKGNSLGVLEIYGQGYPPLKLIEEITELGEELIDKYHDFHTKNPNQFSITSYQALEQELSKKLSDYFSNLSIRQSTN